MSTVQTAPRATESETAYARLTAARLADVVARSPYPVRPQAYLHYSCPASARTVAPTSCCPLTALALVEGKATVAEIFQCHAPSALLAERLGLPASYVVGYTIGVDAAYVAPPAATAADDGALGLRDGMAGRAYLTMHAASHLRQTAMP